MSTAQPAQTRSTRRGRRRSAACVGPMLVLALAAVGVWRFANPDGGTAVTSGDAPTLEQQVARLEASTVERPDDPRVWRDLGLTLAQLAHQQADPTRYQRVEAAFDRADELEPGSPATLVARASVQAVLHQFGEAHRLATAALEVRPMYPDAMIVLVDAEVEMGRYADAVRHLQTLLDHKPSMAALARASYLRELHGDYDGAILALRQAEASGAQAPLADRILTMRIRGDVLFNHGHLDSAEATYHDILRLAPGYGDARIGLARISAARGDEAGGITQLRELLAEVNDPHAWIALADIAAQADEQLEATSVDTARQLLLQDAANGAAIDLELALFDADHGGTDPADTVERAQRAYAARPSVHGADALAWALHRAGRSAEAAPLIAEATRLGSIDASIRFHAAAVQQANGELDQAAENLRRAFRLNPWFSFAAQPEATDLARRLGVPTPIEWARN